MTVAFFTLGCKTNQYETQGLEQLFARRGHRLVPFSQAADVYIVNTCTVTALADKKSRAACRRAKRLNPAAALLVCGCYGQTSPEEVRAATGADFVLGVTGRARVVELAEEIMAGRVGAQPVLTRALWGDDAQAPIFEALPAGGLSGRTRALLKVQDGCQSFCTYCKIPYARGPSRSAPLETAVADTAMLREQGFRELVITGIEISAWGADLPGAPTLTDLIEAVCTAGDGMRVRLGSLEPRTVTEDFAARLSRLPNLCHHFHLSLQSGSDTVLRAMNRRYTAARYAESCAILRRHFPGCAITADLIAGFPGESEEDFAASLALMQACALAGGHVFPFSARVGTRACHMPGHLPAALKDARAVRASELLAELRQRYLEYCVGRTLSVLFETGKTDCWTGYAGEYMPVSVRSDAALGNRVRRVAITGLEGDTLIGKLT